MPVGTPSTASLPWDLLYILSLSGEEVRGDSRVPVQYDRLFRRTLSLQHGWQRRGGRDESYGLQRCRKWKLECVCELAGSGGRMRNVRVRYLWVNPFSQKIWKTYAFFIRNHRGTEAESLCVWKDGNSGRVNVDLPLYRWTPLLSPGYLWGIKGAARRWAELFAMSN